MSNGISVYLGLDNHFDENIALIKKASQSGIKRIFTSLHIPETNAEVLKAELKEILDTAKECNMDVISDVSPRAMKTLGIAGFSLNNFAELGIYTLRLDDGFTTDDIITMSQNDLGIRLQLNASTVTGEFLDKLKSSGTDMTKLEAMHNFFPRENTGLSEEFVYNKTCLLHQYGIKVSAFIPSLHRPRSPIFAGLPTLEMHRKTSFDFSLRHLLAIGIDSVFVGDSLPSDRELELLGAYSDTDAILLRPEPWTTDEDIIDILKKSFTTRPDEARDVIRTQESRRYVQEANITIKADNCGPRNVGYVTLDNENYGRYQGELQIIKSFLQADHRVNIVASLSNDEKQLIKYLTPGKAFKFVF
ncbi:Outer surface protein of unknown function, cellobiose operon [Anaerovibrio sp. JC8]|uniref:DUF871 domain-containing protein n=1 Tax=Anaerovibrio sp. JC8 TaxID=1240085 RepID=UPI000A0A46F9|nr:MupG family TIM beta-alpha barrel fold protein [Anaerovibrio sp. JC8]ORU00322.1 Outer surface protein of unknown function, cellobiose operon [Anaerovibrio sp. JC8]